MTEYATTEVRLLVSPELLDELQANWSPPVQFKVERDGNEQTGWSLTARTIGPPTGDVKAVLDQALYLSKHDLAELATTLAALVAEDEDD